MIIAILKILLKCLVLTIIIELSVSLILGVRKRLDIINIILVQILTNPLVVSISLFINNFYGYKNYRIAIAILEVLAVITEGYIYKKTLNYKKINPFLLSLILNGLSYTLGLVIN